MEREAWLLGYNVEESLEFSSRMGHWARLRLNEEVQMVENALCLKRKVFSLLDGLEGARQVSTAFDTFTNHGFA